MPRVPTATLPQEQTQALQGRQSVSVTPESTGPLEQAGAAMFAIGKDIQVRQDADLVMRAETDIKSQYLQWEAEAKQRKGQQAWGIAKDAGTWWDENGAKVASSLQNPVQKDLFNRTLGQLKGQSLGTFAGIEAAERRASLDASAQASIVGSINLAAANPMDSTALSATKIDIVKRTGMLAKLNGWSPEVAAMKEQEYITNLHKQVIQGLVRDNPIAAESYYNANIKEIEGSQQAEIGAFAKNATATRLGDTTADAAWQAAGPKSDRDPVNLDAMETRIRTELKGNPEAMKSAIAGIKERAASFKASRIERDDQLEGTVNQAILDGKSSRAVRSMPAFLSLSPEKARQIITFMENQEYTKLQRGNAALQRDALLSDREDRAKARTGMGAYLTYSNPETLSGMSEAQVLNLLPSLGTQLTRDLMEKKRTISNPAKLTEAKIDADDFNQIAESMGLHPFKPSKSENEAAALGLLKQRTEQMIAAQQTGGKVLNRDEKLKLMRQEMARTVTTDSGFFSFEQKTPILLLRPEQIKDIVVPAADRTAIGNVLRRQGAAITEDAIRRAYLQRKAVE